MPAMNRSFLTKAAIFLLSAAMVVLTPLVLIYHNSEAALTNPELYKRILNNRHAYDRLASLVADQLIRQLQNSDEVIGQPGFVHITKNSELLLKNLDQAELENLISMLLPTAWGQVKMENIIDQYVASMDNRIYQPVLLIAMEDIKDRLQGKVGLAFFVELVRAQPPCSEQEKNAWQNQSIEEAPACFPSETILKESEPKTRELLYQITARMPDEASLEYFFGPMGFGSGQATLITRLQDSAVRFWRARDLLRISPVFLLVLLFLLGLFHTPARPFTRLWAMPVILAGTVSLIAGALVGPVTGWYIDSQILRNLPPYISPALIETGAVVASDALILIRPLILIQSLLIFLLGGLLFLADRLQRRGFRLRRPSGKKYTL